MREEMINRRSTRTFTGQSLSENDRKWFDEYISNEDNLKGVNGNKIKLVLVEKQMSGKIGTYGFIKNAPAYVAALTKNTEDHMIDVGFVLEKFILHAETRGLGTCWIGGTFNRNKLLDRLESDEDEFVPVITPLGVPAKKQSLTEKFIRKGADANNRLDTSKLFFKDNFNETIENQETLELLHYVRIAPSASNKQPWRVLDTNESFDLYLERTPNYGKLGYDIQMVDMGIALCHFNEIIKESKFFKKSDYLENDNMTYIGSIEK
jgi:hypothetical protein